MSLLDKATIGANCLYWEALKVDFALETLDKKHLMPAERVCGHGAASERDREVDECKQFPQTNY